METPSIWLGVSNQILGLWMGFRVPFKGFGVLWKKGRKGRDFESHPLCVCVWWDAKQPTTSGSSHLHLNLWEESHSYLSRSFCAFFFFCICKTLLWVLGITPILPDVRICRPSLGSEIGRRKGGTYCLTYLCNGTHSSLEWERQFQCYFTREDKHGNRPSRNFEFHWFGEKQEVERLLP